MNKNTQDKYQNKVRDYYISKYIKLSDVIKTSFSDTGYVDPTIDQIKIYTILCNELVDVIIDRFINNKQIIITSGLRNLSVYYKMRSSGYPVSRTSDHFAVEKIITPEEFRDKFKSNIDEYISNGSVYGVNPIGSGAIDFIPLGYKNSDIEKLFYKILDYPSILDKSNQIILYYGKQYFIHISLRRKMIFPFNVDSRSPVLIYKDGSYKTNSYIDKNMKYFLLAKK